MDVSMSSSGSSSDVEDFMMKDNESSFVTGDEAGGDDRTANRNEAGEIEKMVRKQTRSVRLSKLFFLLLVRH